MKTYPPDLLGPWPDDRGPAALPDRPRARGLFPAWHQAAQEFLAELAGRLRGPRDADGGWIDDRLYRRAHVVSGLAGLLQVPKAAHLLAILDFTLDVGRTLHTQDHHALTYVGKLLGPAAAEILEELHRAGRCDRDLTGLVEESANYLRVYLRKAGATPSRPFLPAVALPRPEAAAEAAPEPVAEEPPEVLQIPPDKYGLTSVFCEEAREGLTRLGRQLVALEEAGDPLPLVNDLFRNVHTLKGGAGFLKVRRIEGLAHRMEALLDRLRQGRRRPDQRLVDLLLEGKKLLERMVDEVANAGPIRTATAGLLRDIAAWEGGLPPGEAPPPASAAPAAEPRPPTPAADTIRVPAAKLDGVLNAASEVFINRIRLAGDVAALGAGVRQFRQALQRLEEFTVEAVLDRLAEANARLLQDLRALLAARRQPPPQEQLAALVGRFHQDLAAAVRGRGLTTAEELALHLRTLDEGRKRLHANVEHLEQVSARLQTGAMSFRMVPVAHLFDRFPTQVRETARQLGKKVHLEVSGADTELDKVLIHQLADPLLHLLRNSLDHGIEPPAEREARGKPAAGRVGLHAYYEGAQAVIEVRDDGRGIDAERVRVKAIAAGLVDPAAAAGLTPQEIFPFIFEPGLSTAAAVSTVSGRGVGLDVVRTAVRQLQGGITVDSAPGVGTTIWLQLPLMLAVVGVLLVRERAHLFALAIQHVEEILAVRPADLRRAGGNTLYGHRGATLPVTTLSSVLGFPPSLFSEAEAYLVILTDGEKRVGVLVDAVLGRQEVLTKGLGSLIKRAPFVMGCTILSDSRLVLLLDAGALVHAQNRKPWASARAPAPEVRSARRRQPVLVVDDSAIQRNHLRALLGQAGYAVDVAENGFEAWQRAQQRHHAAYCVDLVMPVMDGVEFVGRLRRLPGREASPVVFITGRATPAERDRAAQLGGCAYFEKPVDADALVETLDRFCLTPAGREGGA